MTREKSDKYYKKKYNLTDEELEDYKQQVKEINDPDLIIEDLITPEIRLTLSDSAKIEYLTKLRSKVVKVLYLIEQKDEKDINPQDYMKSLLFDMNSANLLFEEELTEIYVKFYGIYSEYENIKYETIRKQIFEVRSLVDRLKEKISKRTR